MTPEQARVLGDVRRHIKDFERGIALMEGGQRMGVNGQDSSDELIAYLRARIGEMQQLLARLDPDNATDLEQASGNG
jgi:hypothetical protein